MNYLKTFEKFFSFYIYDQLKDVDLKKLIGITRYEIEDYLLSIDDDFGDILNTSINFELRDKLGNSFIKEPYDIKSLIKKNSSVIVSIHFYPNGNKLDELIEKYERNEFSKTEEKLPIFIMGDRLQKFEEELQLFKERMEFFKFEVEIRENNKIASNRNIHTFISKNRHTDLKDDYYGHSIMSIFLNKKINK
jgi:hypothetical protein